MKARSDPEAYLGERSERKIMEGNINCFGQMRLRMGLCLPSNLYRREGGRVDGIVEDN
jgi:hypothetical protein